MGSDLKERIFHAGGTLPNSGCNKVSVIGAGNVGAACAFAILLQVRTQGQPICSIVSGKIYLFLQELCTELVIVDINEARVQAEVKDLQHGLCFMGHAKVNGSSGIFELCNHTFFDIHKQRKMIFS